MNKVFVAKWVLLAFSAIDHHSGIGLWAGASEAECKQHLIAISRERHRQGLDGYMGCVPIESIRGRSDIQWP